MIDVGQLETTDLDSMDDLFVSVRVVAGNVYLGLSLRHGGDLEVALSHDDAEQLARLLGCATQGSAAQGDEDGTPAL
jgi:hypothetical protein